MTEEYFNLRDMIIDYIYNHCKADRSNNPSSAKELISQEFDDWMTGYMSDSLAGLEDDINNGYVTGDDDVDVEEVDNKKRSSELAEVGVWEPEDKEEAKKVKKEREDDKANLEFNNFLNEKVQEAENL